MTERVQLELQPPTLRDCEAFLAAVRRSRALHRGLVKPPGTRDELRAFVARCRQPSHASYLIRLPGGDLAGVVNLNEIVGGAFQSAYLGYYAFTPHAGHGHMTAGLKLVLGRAFRTHRLHRVEANIQPQNRRSIDLVERLGFRLEGFSPRYLRIAGRWRDHERWALTVEEWRAARRG